MVVLEMPSVTPTSICAIRRFLIMFQTWLSWPINKESYKCPFRSAHILRAFQAACRLFGLIRPWFVCCSKGILNECSTTHKVRSAKARPQCSAGRSQTHHPRYHSSRRGMRGQFNHQRIAPEWLPDRVRARR